MPKRVETAASGDGPVRQWAACLRRSREYQDNQCIWPQHPVKVILKLPCFSVLECGRFLAGSGREEEAGVFMGREMSLRRLRLPHDSSSLGYPLTLVACRQEFCEEF